MRVLVVDGEPEIAGLEVELLRSEAYDAWWCEGSEAIAAMRIKRPDAAVLEDGSELVAAMQADPELASIPVVLVRPHDASELLALVREAVTTAT